MSEKGIFKEIRDALDEVMSGRRYLISQIEKLKKSLPELGPQVQTLSSSIEAISGLSETSTKLTQSLDKLDASMQTMNTLNSNIESMRNDLSNLSNNVMALRPVLDSVRDYSQRQENGLRGIHQAVQALMGQMGQILAKLE
ncbi:MAG: hypothetical protein EU544_02750 [Promethearchaeota archaeon]|nr:MAG: hypothetical protein EU544_02750 [Candidatus Lokiarchaeota archaeon]